MAAGIIALTVSGILYGVLVKQPAAAIRPDMANPGAATGSQGAQQPPDISQLTPEERFIRLNDRVMAAVEQGDSATALRFLPMALAAYGMLDRFDPDLRYHAALLHVTTGEYPQALALADTILAENPDHLFGWIIRATVAEARSDQPALARARKGFEDHYQAELKHNRPEYQEHQQLLDDFRRQAGDTP